MPGALVAFMFLVVRPGAPSSVFAPSSDAEPLVAFMFLVVRPEAPSSVLASSSVFAPSSDARSL